MAGTSAYPGALDDFSAQSPTNLGDDDSTGRTHSERHDDLEAAMEAVQGELGVDPAGPSASTVAARFTALDSSMSGKASASVTITAGNGLSGGGDLSADRTLSASFATANPLVNGTASAGSSNAVSRGDHVHPTDTTRAALASPTFTGTPAAPTASVDTNTTQIATTAYVVGQGYLKSASAATVYAPINSASLTGTPTAPTASVGNNTTQLATTAFVNSEIANDAVLKSVATASAQVLVGAASGSVVALSPGSAGQVLSISSSATYGLAWTTPTSGSGGANVVMSPTEPGAPSDGTLWVDTDSHVPTFSASGFIPQSVASASGQVLVGAGAASVAALSSGSAGQVLTVSGSATYGLAWLDPAGGATVEMSDTEPVNPDNGTLWVDTDSNVPTFTASAYALRSDVLSGFLLMGA
jgi:hypothetical protein